MAQDGQIEMESIEAQHGSKQGIQGNCYSWKRCKGVKWSD